MIKFGKIIGNLVRRFRWPVQRLGIINTLRLAIEHIAKFVIAWRPSFRAETRDAKKRALAFDERFGVNTAGFIHSSELKTTIQISCVRFPMEVVTRKFLVMLLGVCRLITVASSLKTSVQERAGQSS